MRDFIPVKQAVTLRKLPMSTLAIFLLVTLTSCPGGELSSVILGDKINSAVEKITWGLDRSIISADYRLEKNLRTLQLITTNIQNEFNREMQKNRNFVSEEMIKNIDKIHTLIDEVKGGILEVEDFLVLDAQNIINQVPFKKDIFLIRRIDGYSSSYKETGSYSFTIIGNAFQPGKYYRIAVDDTAVDASNIYLKSANQLSFALPVSRLNSRFSDFAITRTKLKILCFEKADESKAFFTFEGEILLLPKFPVSYVLTEFSDRQIWSAQKYYKQFSFDLGPTGQNGRWERVGRSVTVDDPLTQRFIRVISKGSSGSHSGFGEESFTPDYKTYHVIIANQCHDCSRTFFGTLEYEKMENGTDVEKRYFESDQGSKGLLSYGTHSLTLKEKYQLFELSIEFFNGEKVFLNRENMTNPENGCKVSIAKGETGSLRRFALEISKK